MPQHAYWPYWLGGTLSRRATALDALAGSLSGLGSEAAEQLEVTRATVAALRERAEHDPATVAPLSAHSGGGGTAATVDHGGIIVCSQGNLMSSATSPLVHRARRATATAAVTAALIAAAGCGSSSNGAKGNPSEGSPKRAAATAPTSSGGDRTAKLISEAIDVTLDQDYLRSTRRKRTEGTTVMHSAMSGDTKACKAHAWKGAATLDWVITPSALYTRGSKEALQVAPEAKKYPTRVKVLADRWVKRNADVYEVMRDMCAPKTRRDWLEKRLPSLGQLKKTSSTQRPATVQGRPATRITYKWEGGAVEFHIATEGKPFLLRVTNPAMDLDESFSDFGKPFRVAAPPGAATEEEMAEEVLAAQ
ncbi:hypothetical protein [Streptomyces sp. WAC 01529]|uniref:hypothetical protein n=1 Tax=Streptomyces sp. WAC 01529 TaxID=2203205 RepID=UPI000F7451CC|nr:hypothetical protein [Streptomyces sp. WAC 01529]